MRTAKVEQEVIQLLFPGPWSTTDLVRFVANTLAVSVQGVYKAIRKLRAEEVVTMHGKSIALSGVWIARQKERLLFAEQAYRGATEFSELLQSDVGKVVCSFKTLKEVDLFWTHAYFQLAERVDPAVPSYSVQPHDWYPYVRSETDTYWIQKHTEVGRLSRIVLTHAGLLDRRVIQERKRTLGALFEYSLNNNPLNQKSTTYYSLLGPYVFKAEFDQKIATAIDAFVARHDTLPLPRKAQAEIAAILDTKGTFKFTIEKSVAKAGRLTNKVKKYFEF